jgi:hypothetical protein
MFGPDNPAVMLENAGEAAYAAAVRECVLTSSKSMDVGASMAVTVDPSADGTEPGEQRQDDSPHDNNGGQPS